MRARCYNINSPDFPGYGARGITVCGRWRHSFENFLADMGPRQPGASIHRINGKGNYEPGNCVWATDKVQGRGRRNAKLDMNAVEQICTLLSTGVSQQKIAEKFGVTRSLINQIKMKKTWM